MLLEAAESLLEWDLESGSEVDEKPSHERAERLEGYLSDSGFSLKMDL